jgi:hypothetical protein
MDLKTGAMGDRLPASACTLAPAVPDSGCTRAADESAPNCIVRLPGPVLGWPGVDFEVSIEY